MSVAVEGGTKTKQKHFLKINRICFSSSQEEYKTHKKTKNPWTFPQHLASFHWQQYWDSLSDLFNVFRKEKEKGKEERGKEIQLINSNLCM